MFAIDYFRDAETTPATVEAQTPPPAVHVAVLQGRGDRKLLHVHRAGDLDRPERGSDRRSSDACAATAWHSSTPSTA